MKKYKLSALAVTLVVLAAPAAVWAAATPTLDQTINGGTLATDILDSNRAAVVSPTATISNATFSFDCQTVTGTLGDNDNRVYVINPSGTSNGWTLTLGATNPVTAKWTDAGSDTYAFNDATGTPAGCTNGQLTVDPLAATINNDCSGTACTGATITKGSSTAMSGSTAVTLMAGDATANSWRGYLTGIGLSQKIPAEQPAGSYSLGMTLTVTAVN